MILNLYKKASDVNIPKMQISKRVSGSRVFVNWAERIEVKSHDTSLKKTPIEAIFKALENLRPNQHDVIT